MDCRQVAALFAILLISAVPVSADYTAADSDEFELYRNESSPEAVHTGPLINCAAGFKVSGTTVTLEKGFVLSDTAYMRLSSDGITYGLSISISGIRGFLSQTGLTFEFYDGESKILSLPVDGTADTDKVFKSGRNYGIRIVTTEKLSTDSYPKPESGVTIRLDVITGTPGKEPEVPKEDKEKSEDKEPVDIVLDSKVTGTELLSLKESKGRMTASLPKAKLRFDEAAKELILSVSDEEILFEMTDITKEDDRGMRYELSVTADGNRITDLGSGSVSITLSCDTTAEGYRAFAIDTDGKMSPCACSFNRDAGELTITSGQCYMFYIEPIVSDSGITVTDVPDDDMSNDDNGLG